MPDDAFLEALSDGVYRVDRDGRCTYINKAALSILGFHAKEDLLGRAIHDVIHHTRADGTPFPASECALLKAGHSGEPVTLSDEMLWRRDGSSLKADYSAFPLCEGGGSLIVINESRTRRETQLRDTRNRRELNARFRALANGIPQLSWITNADGEITWYNDRWYEFTGTNFAEMAGWGWRKVHHPDHIERVERRFRHALTHQEPWEDTFPLRARDGTYRWFLSRAALIRDEPDHDHPEGQLIGWFGTNTDITAIRDAEHELERARDEAESANRAKSTFIANMSHELRTPLSAIIGYAEMMSEEIEEGTPPEDLARDVTKIEGNARHLLGLINDVLDLSKVESGKMEAFVETFDIKQMAEEVASTVGTLVARKNNRFDLILADNLGEMRSDITRVRQILLNLLSNAAKFTEDGEIRLRVARKGETCIFEVEDNGIGMSEEQLAKLFQRFQQADMSTTRQFGGTGLGLALTKAFANLLDGTISVRSVSGEGTTFTVRLPVTLDQKSSEIEADLSAAHDGSDTDGRALVLVIDDDLTQCELMGRFLSREGYSARMAHDGRTGLRLAKQLKPHLILLDVTMPGLDGWSVLSLLKSDPDLAVVPVVMVTFLSERALASSLGAADYVIKPVDWNRLRHVMDRFREFEGDVLIVDDEDDMRNLTRIALEKNGWTVVEAKNGVEALDVVARAVPRVILLDLSMPIMDGFTFLKELRAKPGCAQIPVVVLTALDLTVEDRRRLRGANQVLSKGQIKPSELADKLKKLGLEVA